MVVVVVVVAVDVARDVTVFAGENGVGGSLVFGVIRPSGDSAPSRLGDLGERGDLASDEPAP